MREKLKRIVHVAVHLGGGVGKAISGLLCDGNRESWVHTLVLLDVPIDYRYVDCCINAGIKVVLSAETGKNEMTALLTDADAIVINWWGHPLMPKFIIDHLAGISGRWFFWFHINGCCYPYIPPALPADSFGAFFTTGYSLENPLWSSWEHEHIKEKASIVYGMGNFLPSEIQPKRQYSSERFHIGYVGTISYSKMDCHMLKYMERLRSRIPEVRVTLVGECDKEIREEIREKNMEDFITCTGHVDDIEPYYQSFDIFLYLLSPENYGTTENVLLEAMAAGLPIIVWNNPVERNIIKHGQNGYIANGEQELLEIAETLSADEAMRKEAGGRARDYVCREYDAMENRQRYLNVLSKQCRNPKKRYPFEKNIGASPYEWFQFFTGKNRENFAKLCVDNLNTDDELISWVKKLPPIYIGKHKSSIYHFLEYYPRDKQLQQISYQIEMIQALKEEKNE